MSEALEATKKEKQVQARLVSTTLLTATSSDTISPEVLRAVGFNPKKAPAIILPDVDTMSEAGDSELESNQDPTGAGSPLATPVRYSQSHPEAVEAGQASSKHHPDLTKPSTSLPTLVTTGDFICPLMMVKWVGLTAF